MADFRFTRNLSGHPKLKKICADIEEDIYRGFKDDKKAIADASMDVKLAAAYIKEQFAFCAEKTEYDASVLDKFNEAWSMRNILDDMENLSEDRRSINKAGSIAEDMNDMLLYLFLRRIPEELNCPMQPTDEEEEMNYMDKSVWEIARDFHAPLQREAPWILHDASYYDDASMVRYQNDLFDWFDRQDKEAQKKVIQAVKVFKFQKRAAMCLLILVMLPGVMIAFAELAIYAWLSDRVIGWFTSAGHLTAAGTPFFYWMFTGVAYAVFGIPLYELNKYIMKKIDKLHLF